MPAFDVLICLKDIDSAILPHTLKGIQTHAKPNAITIVASQSTITQCQKFADIYPLQYIDEDSLYEGLTLQAIQRVLQDRIGNTRRAGWYLQQFIKMAYASYKLSRGGRIYALPHLGLRYHFVA